MVDGWTKELLRDPHAVADKRARVRQMFAAIAPSYDLNNRLHSLWQDQHWRRRAVKLADVKPGDVVVDVACGTGDLTQAFAARIHKLQNERKGRAPRRDPSSASSQQSGPNIIGIDFTFEMLPIATEKSRHARRSASYINGDALNLPLPDAYCDVVSIAFGIRNVSDPAAAVREFRRILRPGGRLVILEFSLPENPVLRGLYNFYFRHILPRTATIVSGDKTGAYKYLPESVNTFISRNQMIDTMQAAGFESVRAIAMTCGVCIGYRGLART